MARPRPGEHGVWCSKPPASLGPSTPDHRTTGISALLLALAAEACDVVPWNWTAPYCSGAGRMDLGLILDDPLGWVAAERLV